MAVVDSDLYEGGKGLRMAGPASDCARTGPNALGWSHVLDAPACELSAAMIFDVFLMEIKDFRCILDAAALPGSGSPLTRSLGF